MEGTRFSEKVIINCSPVEVFDYTQDYKYRLHWDTFLQKAELMDGAISAGKGVKAYCVAKNGLGMVTEYVSFNRPIAVAIKMTEGPYMFKSFLGSWRFKNNGGAQTEVIFLYSFKLRLPFKLLTPFVKRNLRISVRQRLVDLKTNLESKTSV